MRFKQAACRGCLQAVQPIFVTRSGLAKGLAQAGTHGMATESLFRDPRLGFVRSLCIEQRGEQRARHVAHGGQVNRT
jgi:hypothetical protein